MTISNYWKGIKLHKYKLKNKIKLIVSSIWRRAAASVLSLFEKKLILYWYLSFIYIYVYIHTHHIYKSLEHTKNKMNWYEFIFSSKILLFHLNSKMENFIQEKQILKLWSYDTFGSTDFLRGFPLFK